MLAAQLAVLTASGRVASEADLVFLLRAGRSGRSNYANKDETSLDVTPNRRHLGLMKLDSTIATASSVDRINRCLSGHGFTQIDEARCARA